MAGESTFEKIKRVIEDEKNRKTRGEARLASLEEERNRIFKQIKEDLNIDVSSVEELEEICEKLEGAIKDHISKMVEVLREEGIEL
jgi:flagellar biosynthesis chaperone FliJ